MASCAPMSTMTDEIPISDSSAGVRRSNQSSHFASKRAEPSSITARASSSLDPKWKYRAPLVTCDSAMISLKLALA